MNNIRLSFSVDADSVSLKSILKKDFLELQMRAISSANPNLNGSWFTREALEDAVESCKNKPILGYFNADGDFESHNGTWRRDVETGLDYWDTKDGEQVLGLIRDTDDIKVVDDADGLSWLCLSCALWTQYNFKQVKRLIKDAKKAKEVGGVTKNISVEIDILEGEKLENGVYRIDKFKLAGITILGSRRGAKVLPGIADAALSIPEILGSDFYAKQESVIRAAYARLSNNVEEDGTRKEDVLNMEMNEEIKNVQEQSDIQLNAINPEEENKQNFEQPEKEPEPEEGEKCPECGENPCVCSSEEKPVEEEKEEAEHCAQEHEGCGEEEIHPEDEQKEHEAEGEKCEKCEKEQGEEEEGEGEPEHCDCGEPELEESPEEEPEPEEEVEEHEKCESEEENEKGECFEENQDAAWLNGKLAYSVSEIDSSIHYYEVLMESYPDKAPHGAYIINVLKRMRNYYTKIEGTIGVLLAKLDGEILEADEQYEAKLMNYESNVDGLIENYEKELDINKELVENNESLKTRLDKYAHEEFMAQVNGLIGSAKLNEQVSKEIYEACENGTLRTYDEVKVKVALAAFEAQHTDENILSNNISLQSPVITPDVKAAFEAEAEKSSKKRDSWTVMREHYGKKNVK